MIRSRIRNRRLLRCRKGTTLTGTEAVLNSVRAELGEHFDDFIVLARSRNPDKFMYTMSDPQWAVGAMERKLENM